MLSVFTGVGVDIIAGTNAGFEVGFSLAYSSQVVIPLMLCNCFALLQVVHAVEIEQDLRIDVILANKLISADRISGDIKDFAANSRLLTKVSIFAGVA